MRPEACRAGTAQSVRSSKGRESHTMWAVKALHIAAALG
jgi:hypothetical protein